VGRIDPPSLPHVNSFTNWLIIYHKLAFGKGEFSIFFEAFASRSKRSLN
jgi:hypothetical protein